MLTLDKTEVFGWEAAIRGARNPMNSWNRSDSYFDGADYIVGENDAKLLLGLRNAGSPDHRKYLRMISVTVDINAPLYWWKEFDTYKVGTTANSCSTMHKIAARDFTIDDFSCEHLNEYNRTILENIIFSLNYNRKLFIERDDKKYWWQMVQMLPSSYNQRRTIALNYEVLANIYKSRRHHKLDEWHIFCDWIESLPYSEFITGKES